MVPAPGFGAMQPGGMGGPMAGGGARGEVRNPVTIVLLSLVTCGIYGYYWFYYQLMPELRAYLGRNDEYNPTTQVILSIVTCGIWYLLGVAKACKMIQEGQQRAGRPNAEDKTNLIWILFAVNVLLGVPTMLAIPWVIQTEANKIWDPSLS
jgi:hypothetical protein